MDVYGATDRDFATVKVKNSQPRPRPTPTRATARKSTEDEVLASPMVSDPLRLLEICATSDGGAAVVLASMEFARKRTDQARCTIAAISTVTPRYPNTVIEMPNFATDSAAGVAVPDVAVPRLDRARRHTRRRASGPRT